MRRYGVPRISGELPGAPIASSNGNLMVVRGFDSDENVIVNDPAATSDAQVRTVYDRAAASHQPTLQL